MARQDYHEQMLRHVGEWDVLPNGLLRPSLPHGSDWQPGACRGTAVLSDAVLEGNRWPAVSGALLAEFARRCATLSALTLAPSVPSVRPRQLEVHFRRAIPVASPRRRPHVGDDKRTVYWQAKADAEGNQISSEVAVRRGHERDAETCVTATVGFDVSASRQPHRVDLAMSEYLRPLPTRMVLPRYLPGWTASQIEGDCAEKPGSVLAVAEQALGDAGKIVRGVGIPEEEDESMLIASMRYRWLHPVDDALVHYVASAGPRGADRRGRHWVEAGATLRAEGVAVGEATGSVVLQRQPRR